MGRKGGGQTYSVYGCVIKSTCAVFACLVSFLDHPHLHTLKCETSKNWEGSGTRLSAVHNINEPCVSVNHIGIGVQMPKRIKTCIRICERLK